MSIAGFKICRNERLFGRGEGVVLYISENIEFTVAFSFSESNGCESVFIEIGGNDLNLTVGVVYLSNGNVELMDEKLSDFLVQYPNAVIMGDFNNNMFTQ